MDGKSRYLGKNFVTVWNTYNEIHIVNAAEDGGILEKVLPIFSPKPLKVCGCSGKSKAASTIMSLTSISTFESNNKGLIKYELDILRAYGKLELEQSSIVGIFIFKLTIGGTKIKLLPGVYYNPGTVFEISWNGSREMFFETVITDDTLESYRTLYKTLSINVDAIITSIAYINFLYEMFYNNRTILENIKSSLKNRKKFDVE
jgi:hypothetical protein